MGNTQSNYLKFISNQGDKKDIQKKLNKLFSSRTKRPKKQNSSSSTQFEGENISEVGASYKNNGEGYSELDEKKKALEYNQKSLSIKKEIYGENHPDVATSYDNIAYCYCDLGELKKALEFYEKSLLKAKNFMAKIILMWQNHMIILLFVTVI